MTCDLTQYIIPGVVQVELVLSQHPGVAGVVVVGAPDSRLGEKVIACVSIKDGWKWVDARTKHQGKGKEVSPQTLHEHCWTKKLSRWSSDENILAQFSKFSFCVTDLRCQRLIISGGSHFQ